MKFSQKFLIYIFLVLMMTIGSNIVALKYFATEYFGEYLTSIKKETPDINFDLIGAFTKTKNLDDATIEEYRKTLSDLSGISTSLENFSDNPQNYAPSIIDSLQKIGVPENSIEQVLFVKALDSFFSGMFNFSFLSNTTPEGQFILKVIRAMFILNIVIILIVLIVSWFWVHKSFRPIRFIIENLSDIISRKGYKQIEYKKKDEFGALIGTINSLNKNLSRQQKIRSDLLSDLSHEIKTPITAIKCYLEGMDDGVIEATPKNYALLHKEINRLIDITGSIMEYEKLEQTDQDALKIVEFDFWELTKHLETEYVPLLAKRNQQIAFPKNTTAMMFRFDEGRFIQLIHNIFSNFIKYAGDGKTLTIKTSEGHGKVFLTFRDNGGGVPKKEIAFIREKFYQVDKSRSATHDRGIGIGLSIIEKIVSLHKGSLTIESDTDKGFCLKMSFAKI
ncbi:MAG: HAMP domain-containing sensor histidine kinase [Candidatus Gracilibacteria bacterium]|nr:HAMP domain-containing sensor histidine kinase [Candidatus Gracilibacteria bacterium]